MVAKFSFCAILWAVFIGWCGFKRRRRLWKTVLYLLLPVALAWLLSASVSHTQQICGSQKSKYCVGGDFKGFFSVDTVMHRIIDKGYEPLYKTLWLLLFLVPVMAIYVMLTLPNGLEWDIVELVCPDWEWINSTRDYLDKVLDRRKASLGNAVFVFVVFVIYLVRYDASKSYEPEWIDVLG
jgi:hypothetical protein